MLALIFEFRHGHADIPGSGAIVKNSNQSLRLRKWQRLEKDCLNQREDGDVATNSERQSHHANEKKSRRLYKCSRSIAQIGDEIFHRFVSCSLERRSDIPQVHYYHNDIAVSARFCYSLGRGFRSNLGGAHPMDPAWTNSTGELALLSGGAERRPPCGQSCYLACCGFPRGDGQL